MGIGLAVENDDGIRIPRGRAKLNVPAAIMHQAPRRLTSGFFVLGG
jgi:hypothetical protein